MRPVGQYYGEISLRYAFWQGKVSMIDRVPIQGWEAIPILQLWHVKPRCVVWWIQDKIGYK